MKLVLRNMTEVHGYLNHKSYSGCHRSPPPPPLPEFYTSFHPLSSFDWNNQAFPTVRRVLRKATFITLNKVDHPKSIIAGYTGCVVGMPRVSRCSIKVYNCRLLPRSCFFQDVFQPICRQCLPPSSSVPCTWSYV